MVVKKPVPMWLKPATKPVSQHKTIDPRPPMVDSNPRDIPSRSGNRMLVKAMRVGYMPENVKPLMARTVRASHPLPSQINKRVMIWNQSMASTMLVCCIESVNLLQANRPRTMNREKTESAAPASPNEHCFASTRKVAPNSMMTSWLPILRKLTNRIM